MSVFKIIVLVTVLSFGVLWIRIEVNRSGREIGRLQNEVEIKEARNQYLQLEILRMTSPQEITQKTHEKFGFEPIKPHHVVVLEK